MSTSLSFFQKLHRSPFFIRLFNWEHWPMQWAYAPIVPYLLWLALKARNPFFFSAANPDIETGGMFGESKFHILERLPQAYKPKTMLAGGNEPVDGILSRIEENGIGFPLIAKPNVGERGLLVTKINDQEALRAFLNKNRIDIVIQSYVDLPFEASVLFYRMPGETTGHISSITLKEFLTVTGDGRSTVSELMKADTRASLQIDRLASGNGQAHYVLPRGERIQLEPIGNHCRGTKFINGTHLVEERMVANFQRLTEQLGEVWFCRYDLRAPGLESLRTGEGIQVVEINGVGAEPGHVYDPEYPLSNSYRDLFKHWRNIYEISRANKKRGFSEISIQEGRAFYRKYKAYMKSVKA